MPTTIIESYPKEKREAAQDGSLILNISECFCDTIQGEGINIGIPAMFLRFQNCTLNCGWCDTQEVWRVGNPYSINELLELWEKHNIPNKLFGDKQHLVFTGGSPLRQQRGIIALMEEFKKRYGFLPYIEIENECTLMPHPSILKIVECWNNSPKLENSGNRFNLRYKPEVLEVIAKQPNSWFKFVITSEKDWEEIHQRFIVSGLISPSRILIMPEGATREELQAHYQTAIDIALEHGLRVTDRLHVTIWNKKTGV